MKLVRFFFYNIFFFFHKKITKKVFTIKIYVLFIAKNINIYIIVDNLILCQKNILYLKYIRKFKKFYTDY